MKHYLDLIKISARQHRRQSRMTRLCIVLAVFLVTVIFGMADMEMRAQLIQAKKSDGSWHAAFVMDEKQGALLGTRPEINTIARYGTLNYHLRDGYQIKGIETGICGFDMEFQDMIPDARVMEGTFPQNADETVINENIRDRLDIRIGDTIDITLPQGDTRHCRVTGIAKNTALTAELDAFCVFFNTDGFSTLHSEETGADMEMLYFVKFRSFCNIQRAIAEISQQFALSPQQVRQNAKVLMLMFQSKDPYMMQLYLVAAVLAVLVVIAGIFMITASMNSNVARRTEFFGLMRCLGATKRQVARYVRREALSWCKTAIPAGVIAGTVIVWVLCGMLRYLSPGLFEELPMFGISWLGIAAGIFVGFITVIAAAKSPSKRAAKVSPLTAVSGNAGTVQAMRRAANTRLFKVDTALGIHHALGSKKNFLLVSGSFAFSIVLFLAFSTAIDFMGHAITPLRPSAPDLSLYMENSSNQIPSELVEKIREMPKVKRTFGRRYAEVMLPAEGRGILMVSYDRQQFQWIRDSLLLGGSLEDAADGKGVLAVFLEGSPYTVGDRILLSAAGEEREIPIAGIMANVPYHSLNTNISNITDMLICSEELFEELTGEQNYAVLDVQLNPEATDTQVREIRQEVEQACGTGLVFSDRRIKNQEARGASYSMSVFLYGFLAVIALIGFFNMINNIAMSVSARTKEYGAMRAIGMSRMQLFRMVAGEAAAYALFGVAFGCAAGLPLNRVLFRSLVTSRWGDAWSIPGSELLVILIIMLGSVCLAVIGPTRQIRKMTIVDTINRE